MVIPAVSMSERRDTSSLISAPLLPGGCTKSACSYGWDWGPVLMTVGPWKPIKLETYTVRIADVDVRARVAEDLSATLDVSFTLTREDHSIASVSLKSADGSLVAGQNSVRIAQSGAKATFKLSAGSYDLWYPVGYGKQPLYTVEIAVADQVRFLVNE